MINGTGEMFFIVFPHILSGVLVLYLSPSHVTFSSRLSASLSLHSASRIFRSPSNASRGRSTRHRRSRTRRTYLLFLSLVFDDPIVARKLSLSLFSFSSYQAFLQVSYRHFSNLEFPILATAVPVSAILREASSSASHKRGRASEGRRGRRASPGGPGG